MTNRKSHTPFRLVPKSTTLDDLDRPIRTVLQKRYVFGAHHKNLNEDRPILSAAKCRTMALVSGGIRLMWIFADVPRGWSVKRQWGCREQQFSVFSLAIFRTLLRLGQRYYMAICSPLSAFQWSQNAWPWMTLNGCFALNSRFRASLAGWDHATSENNFVKTNNDRHILSAVQIFAMDSSFRWYKVCADIPTGSLERRR